MYDHMLGFRKVPFLNGGLFEPDSTASAADLHVTNSTFATLFTDLLERYNFTVMEDTPLDLEVAVDPEMLGKIFEELVTGRHESGAYYTPRPIVSFMCKEALKGYLGHNDSIERLIEHHDASGLSDPEVILEHLRHIKVCDPACGSGAYLVGMLQELMALRHALFASHRIDSHSDYDRKLDIIQNCLYGVDIDPIAVSIARLRLWLTLCVEYEVQDGGDPPPLPNLDFKIERADSVLAPTVAQGAQLNDEQIHQFTNLKAKYLKEPYNKAPLRQKIEAMRESLSRWIAHDQSKAAETDFDWRLDFAEVLSQGENPGFDVVLANPPYVRQEIIRLIKPDLKTLYPDVYSGAADLFTYFFARAMELLRERGRLVFICSSTWTKTAAAMKLRNYLRDNATVTRWLDFGDLPVFENVTTYPAIIIAERGKPPKDHAVRASQVRTILQSELESELHAPGILVPQKELDESGWRFEDRRIARLRQKIQDAGVALKDVVNGQIYRGILTGLNKAFVIDQQTRDALVAADPKSKEILKPFLEGKDLKPWHANWRGLWLILIPAGWTYQKSKKDFKSEKQAFAFFKDYYPAVADWLETYKEEARKRCDQGTWYWELRACAYYEEFEKPKIMYPDITVQPRFVFDDKGYYFSNTTYFIPNADRYIQGILCSQLLWWQLTGMVRLMRGGYLRLFSQYIEVLPIASPSASDRRKIASLAEALSSESCPTRLYLEAELNDRVAALYGLTPEERKIIAASSPQKSATTDEKDEEMEEIS